MPQIRLSYKLLKEFQNLAKKKVNVNKQVHILEDISESGLAAF